jgi:hypothetical protein
LTAQPLLTTALSTAVISAIGDVGSQLLIERREFDPVRTLRFSALGLVLTGPTLHVWYGFLYRHFPGVTAMKVLQRVAFDQAVFAPAFTGTIVSVIFAVEGRSKTEWEEHMDKNFVEAVYVNWLLWIPAQIINFRFIAPVYNVLFANFVAVFWNS